MRTSIQINEWNNISSQTNVNPRMREMDWLKDNNKKKNNPYLQLFPLMFTAHIPCLRKCVRLEKRSPLHSSHSYSLHVATLWNSPDLEVRNADFPFRRQPAYFSLLYPSEAKPPSYTALHSLNPLLILTTLILLVCCLSSLVEESIMKWSNMSVFLINAFLTLSTCLEHIKC